MHLIRPFTGLRPVPERAADVAAPPYDVLSTDEARVRAHGRPWSFLHISKPEIDLPKKDDEVTEGDWNPTPRRGPVQVPRNDCGMSSCLRSSL